MTAQPNASWPFAAQSHDVAVGDKPGRKPSSRATRALVVLVVSALGLAGWAVFENRQLKRELRATRSELWSVERDVSSIDSDVYRLELELNQTMVEVFGGYATSYSSTIDDLRDCVNRPVDSLDDAVNGWGYSFYGWC